MRAYAEAMKLAPEVTEIRFWTAVTMISSGREKEALPIFQEVFAEDGNWVEVVKRLPAAGLLPAGGKVLGKILAQAPR